jgi:hypothetical protein
MSYVLYIVYCIVVGCVFIVKISFLFNANLHKYFLVLCSESVTNSNSLFHSRFIAENCIVHY